MIEVGRHKNIPKVIRFCPFCPNSIETEIHFLFHSSVYSIMRETFLKIVTENKPEYYLYSIDEKLQYVMNNIDENIARYVINAFELRTFLLTHPKRII